MEGAEREHWFHTLKGEEGTQVEETKVRDIPVLAVAYIGDAVYELWVRNHVLGKGISRVDSLHRTTVQYVQAKGQAALIKALQADLSEREMEVFLRGRNAKGQHPRNVDVLTYRYATGFEVLIGTLYLSEQAERLEALFSKIASYIDATIGQP